MATNKKPRKIYTPILFRYNKAGEMRLKLPPQISLEQFNKGEGCLAAWDTIFFRIHVGIFLSRYFKEESLSVNFQSAIDSLLVIKKRVSENNTWVMNSLEHDNIREVLNVIDVIQDNTTRKQQLEAYVFVRENVNLPKV